LEFKGVRRFLDIDDRKNLLKQFEAREPEEKLLFSKVLNQASLCEKTHEPCFSDFLDPFRAAQYQKAFAAQGRLNLTVKSFGGDAGAERQMLGFSPDYAAFEESDFPIAVIKIEYDARFSNKLSHRDFLGAILGLGIDRSKIGDINLMENHAFAYTNKEIADYIIYHLEKVGHTKVRCALSEIDADALERSEEEATIIVASMRIDTVVSHIFQLSRGKATALIDAEKVFVNWQPVKSASKPIAEGDTVTLRGKGRAKIIEITGKSKKDRFIVTITRSY
jgi:RNA-binding protein YlmH